MGNTCIAQKKTRSKIQPRITYDFKARDKTNSFNNGFGVYKITPKSETKAIKVGAVFTIKGNEVPKYTYIHGDTSYIKKSFTMYNIASIRYGKEFYQPITTNFKFLVGYEYMGGVGFGKYGTNTQATKYTDSTITTSGLKEVKGNSMQAFIGVSPSFGALLQFGKKYTLGYQVEIYATAGVTKQNNASIFDFDISHIQHKVSVGFWF